MNCEFCAKEFKTKSSLNNHLRTAKYCLKLRGEEAAPEDIFGCDGCTKVFSSKMNLAKHKKICKVDVNNLTKMIRESSDSVIEDQRKELAEKDKQLLEQLAEKDKQLGEKDKQLLDQLAEKDKQLLDQLAEKDKQLLDQLAEKDKTILEQRERIIEVEAQLKIYKEQAEANQEYIQGLADRPTTSTHTMHQNIGEVNQQVLGLERSSCNVESLTALVDDLQFDVIRNGQKGIARAIHARAFKGTNGQTKMLCTDAARDVFKHLDENGDVVKDNKLTNLIFMVYDAGLEDKIDEFREQIPLLTKSSSEREILHQLAAECLQMKHSSLDFRSEMKALCNKTAEKAIQSCKPENG